MTTEAREMEAGREGLRPGDRVEMTEEGYRLGLNTRDGRPCFGTVVRIAGDGSLVVVRDGHKTHERFHPDFWALAGRVETAADRAERYGRALERIRDLSPEPFDEWGQAACFAEAQKIADEALRAMEVGEDG